MNHYNNHYMRALIIGFALALFGSTALAQQVADWVNPFIGTSNFGATHPGPHYPQGLASVVPFNVAFRGGQENPIEKDAAWNSRAYIHENGFLTGFSHVNLSGVGCPELGTLLLMPTTGARTFDAEAYGSTYTGEQASAGYYACTLDKYGIKAEATSTPRTGLSRYTFPEGESNIILNLGLSLSNETGGMLKVVSPQEVEGFRLIGTFCYNAQAVRPVYFVAQLSKPAKAFGAWKKMPKYNGVEAEWVSYDDAYKPYEGYTQEIAGDDVGAYFSFDTEAGEEVLVKLGISYVSIANARENLQAEQSSFDFEGVRARNYGRWNELLSRVKVKGSDEQQTLFYTALYHCLLHPSILQDVNGEYPLMGQPGIGRVAEGRNRYTVFSLWDTYRNLHPLLSLLYPELQEEMVQSMVAMAEEQDWLPKWELLSIETNVMVGDPATPVIADTYLRGLRGFDVETAYAAARKAALSPQAGNPLRPDLDDYLRLGYLPMEDEDKWGGSVSTALEYYLSDWTLAQLAVELGKTEDAERFEQRSLGFLNYLDPETGMLRPKYKDGRFYADFDPEQGKDFEPVPGFVEGTAWQYRFYVPHAIPELIEALGGEETFVRELQACFDTGNYDAANEPDIAYPFLFNYVPGQAWRTQALVPKLIEQHYHNTPGGIPGNDDVGTLSAWLVFSMMGIYPVCPADMDYALFTPSLEEVELQLDPNYYPGRSFRIRKMSGTEEAPYIGAASLNGAALGKAFISHQQITQGGLLELWLQAAPNTGK